MPPAAISPIDIAAVVGYLVLIVAIGFYAARRTGSSDEYFLAGRSLTWPLIGASLFASNISSSTLVGLAGTAYSDGIAVYTYEWMAVVVLVFFVIVLLPLYLEGGLTTVPEYLERRFDGRARLYFSGLTVVSVVALDLAGALYAGALVIQTLAPQVPFEASVWAIAILAGAYTTVGGLRAVVYTDAIQAVLLTLGSALVAWIAYDQVGGWQAVVDATPPEARRLYQPADSDGVPWPGAFSGLILLGIYYWCTNHAIVQRALGARSLEDGRYGALLAGFLKLPVLFIMVMPGLFARVLYPDLASADLVFPHLTLELLPPGIRGLVLIAFVAAIMSSVDSSQHATSTLVTFDFVKRMKPDLTQKQIVTVGRIFAAAFVILGALIAPQIREFPSLWQYLQGILAYITPPIVALYLVGVFWPRANATGAVVSIITSIVTAIVFVLLPETPHFLYVAVILFAIASAGLVVGSLLTAAPPEDKITGTIWTPALWREETARLRSVPVYANYRVLSAALLAVTFVIVGIFWF